MSLRSLGQGVFFLCICVILHKAVMLGLLCSTRGVLPVAFCNPGFSRVGSLVQSRLDDPDHSRRTGLACPEVLLHRRAHRYQVCPLSGVPCQLGGGGLRPEAEASLTGWEQHQECPGGRGSHCHQPGRRRNLPARPAAARSGLYQCILFIPSPFSPTPNPPVTCHPSKCSLYL